MSNLSVFEKNCMDAFGGEVLEVADMGSPVFIQLLDDMENIFLRWKDRDVLKAEKAAYDWAKVGPFLSAALPKACGTRAAMPTAVKSAEQIEEGLRDFFRERTVRRYFPGH